MLKFFKSNHLAQAHKAIHEKDYDQLSRILKKISHNELNLPVSEQLPTLAETCILLGDAKALTRVLEFGAKADLQSSQDQELSLYSLALRQPNSHALLRPLLDYGDLQDVQQLLHQTLLETDEQQLLLLISLYLQHGAVIDEVTVRAALESGNRPLINFLCNSGAELPQDIDNCSYDGDVISYAKRCVEDFKIRKMFLR